MQHQHFDVRTQRDGARLIINVWGEVDLATAPDLRYVLDAAIVAGHSSVTVNLEQVSFCDSSGITALVRATRAARAHRVDLEIVRPRWEIFRVFEVVGIHDLLPFVEPPARTPAPADLALGPPMTGNPIEAETRIDSSP